MCLLYIEEKHEGEREMKKTMCFVIILFLSLVVQGTYASDQQHETLIKGKTRHGFFGGLVMKYTKVNGEYGMMTGFRGGWIINQAFSIGIAGYGWLNGAEDYWQDHWFDDSGLQMGYGGLYLEGIVKSNKVIHFTTGLLLGAGGVGKHWDDHHHFDIWDGDAFWVIEPEINLMINVAKFFRVGFGASYRFCNGIDEGELRNKDLSGLAGMLTLKFGKF
jgi:hypothetical protein